MAFRPITAPVKQRGPELPLWNSVGGGFGNVVCQNCGKTGGQHRWSGNLPLPSYVCTDTGYQPPNTPPQYPDMPPTERFSPPGYRWTE